MEMVKNHWNQIEEYIWWWYPVLKRSNLALNLASSGGFGIASLSHEGI